MPRILHTEVVVPLWDCRVFVVVGRTLDAALAAARRRWPAHAEEIGAANSSSLARTLLLPEDQGVVVLLPADVSMGIFAHECLHAAMGVLRRAGVEVSTENDEAAAYTLGWLIDRLLPWVQRAGATLRA